MEQRAAIKFCFKSGKSGSETFDLSKTAYGDDCFSRTKISEWYARFKNGRPSTTTTDENVERVRVLLSRITVEMLGTKHQCRKRLLHFARCSRETKGVCAKFVPHSLTKNRKEHHRAGSFTQFCRMGRHA